MYSDGALRSILYESELAFERPHQLALDMAYRLENGRLVAWLPFDPAQHRVLADPTRTPEGLAALAEGASARVLTTILPPEDVSTWVDGSARPLIGLPVVPVEKSADRLYHDLLAQFHRCSEKPVLMEFRFPLKSADEAVTMFRQGPLDTLVLGPYLVEKPS